MNAISRGPAGPAGAAELIAASLLITDGRAEVELVARDGQRLRLPTDEATARAIALGIWRALERAQPDRNRSG